MTKWTETDEALAFIATGDSRETSPEIMRAIAYFAHNLAQAEAVWADGPEFHGINVSDIWEVATGNGRDGDGSELCWGAAGSHWMES
jgi:hypothetical protein